MSIKLSPSDTTHVVSGKVGLVRRCDDCNFAAPVRDGLFAAFRAALPGTARRFSPSDGVPALADRGPTEAAHAVDLVSAQRPLPNDGRITNCPRIRRNALFRRHFRGSGLPCAGGQLFDQKIARVLALAQIGGDDFLPGRQQ